MWILWRPKPRATAAQDIARVHGRLLPTRRAAPSSGQGSITWMGLALITVGSVGQSRVRSPAGSPRAGLGVPVCPARTGVLAADNAGRSGAGLRLAGRRL